VRRPWLAAVRVEGLPQSYAVSGTRAITGIAIKVMDKGAHWRC